MMSDARSRAAWFPKNGYLGFRHEGFPRRRRQRDQALGSENSARPHVARSGFLRIRRKPEGRDHVEAAILRIGLGPRMFEKAGLRQWWHLCRKRRLDNVGRVAAFGRVRDAYRAWWQRLCSWLPSMAPATFFSSTAFRRRHFSRGPRGTRKADDRARATVGALPAHCCDRSRLRCFPRCFALPFALGSAIFVVEISPRFGRTVFQPVVELLVGILSVVRPY